MRLLSHWHELSLMFTEGIVILLVTAFCLVASRKLQFLDRLSTRFRDFARERRLAVLSVFLFTLLLRVAAWPVRPVQLPYIHDEFSYLLLADTFAHGHLTNPTHPLWKHFESFHIIQHPVYASVYPIAQGVFLAAGQVLAGAPWVGVWISVALMCAALCWMLQGWLPPAWAFAGGLLAAIRIGMFSYWSNSYWGGAAAALGGALLLGALPRIMRRPKAVHVAVFAIGVVILANSRPYEGFVLCLAVAPVAAAWQFGWNRILKFLGLPSRSGASNRAGVKVFVPGLVILIVAGAFMGYYFQRITGSPLEMPFSLERQQYGIAPAFIWQHDRVVPPHYNNQVMEFFYRNLETNRTYAPLKVVCYWMFFLGPVLTIPFLSLPRLISDHRTRLLLILTAVGIPTVTVINWGNAHYFAPFVPALYAVLLQGMRHISVWGRRYKMSHPTYASFRWVIPGVVVVMIAAPFAAYALRLDIPIWPQTWASPTPPPTARTEITQSLNKIAGRHLIIVRYHPGHNIHEEFVYNDANIDAAKIVWARSIDERSDQELMRYFSGRQVWFMDAAHQITVVPYTAPAPVSAATRDNSALAAPHAVN